MNTFKRSNLLRAKAKRSSFRSYSEGRQDEASFPGLSAEVPFPREA